ncbi:MAG: BlaI/MecI/CopY family transcriptional regulator [Clostridiaceae bacterium]|nr:BlaI/MecI/CopY family transcriptional regulator [Clostridiaceae bacterium]
MIEYKLTVAEENLAEIIWEQEPIRSPELVEVCAEKFNWKKSTTYTMLKKLERKGIVQNNSSVVTSRIKKDDFYGEQSKIFVKENFDNSLPKFIAAFTRSKKLTNEEIEELKSLIDNFEEEG